MAKEIEKKFLLKKDENFDKSNIKKIEQIYIGDESLVDVKEKEISIFDKKSLKKVIIKDKSLDYLNLKKLIESKKYEIRVRSTEKSGEIDYKLTIKSKDSKLERDEYEYKISEKSFMFLSSLSQLKIIKDRYVINIDDLDFEVDIYRNPKIKPVVEIEFKTKEDAEKFNPDSYSILGKDVTGDKKFSNIEIAKKNIRKRVKNNV